MNFSNQLSTSKLKSILKSGLFFLLIVLFVAQASAVAADQESLQQRRQRLEKMTKEELQDLNKKWESFTKLSPDERERYRKLHQEISQDPHAARLMSLLSRYTQWFGSLSYAEREELRDLPADERIKKMGELVRQQDRLQSEKESEREHRRFRRLGDIRLPNEEADNFFSWLDVFAQKHKQEIIELVPEETRSRLLEIPDEKLRNHVMLQALVWRDKKLPSIDEQDIQDLKKSSPRLKQELDAFQSDQEEQEKLIKHWIRAASHARMDRRGGRRPRHRPSQAELERFAREELNKQQRNYIESLPPEEMLHELGRMHYHHQRFMNPQREGRPGGPSRGRGPGPRDPGFRERPRRDER